MVVFGMFGGVLIICTFFCASEAVADEAAYLKALEDEAREIQMDHEPQQKKSYVEGAAVASDDPYLKTLEDEAHKLQLDHRGQKKDASTKAADITKKHWAWEGELIGDILPKGLAKDEFSTLLKQRFYGSFVFYRRLNVIDQAAIYQKYKDYVKPDINVLRREILKLNR